MSGTGSRSAIWYKQAASHWFEALPVGNGRFGGMVYGGAGRERISFNEDTLWSGEPREKVRHDVQLHLDYARQLIFGGRHEEAEGIIEQYMEGEEIESYMPLGDMELWFDEQGEATGYRRELDMDEGIVRTRYRLGGALCTREVFVSAADQVMAVRLHHNAKTALTVLLHSPLRYTVSETAPNRLKLSGRSPYHVLPNTMKAPDPVKYEEGKGMSFELQIHVEVEKGKVETSGGRMRITGSGAITLFIAAATSYNGFRGDPASASAPNPARLCESRLDHAASAGYERLKARHIEEYGAYFGRAALQLGDEAMNGMPTDERIRAVREGADDPGLAALFFQYGRYLLLSSSRPGTQPANLQGIWNDKTQPPWCSSWTTNINVEMNYWPAEVCHLEECHQPLLDWIEDLRWTGRQTAAVHYRSRGWTAHHNIDLWRTSTPVGGSPSWAFWPMAGAWLCHHLWEHYAFSQDERFLERAFPAMKEAALFCLDWLVEGPDGQLVTCPSTSPENMFVTADGQQSSVTYASTLDMALIRDLFGHCIEAGRILQKEARLCGELEEALRRLPPFRIGKHGQLQEWAEDYDELEPGHRHIAHLAALHPLGLFTREDDPVWIEACRASLERRLAHGGAHTGWSCAWTVSFWARLGEPDKAHRFLNELLAGTHLNLMNAHRHPKVKLDIFQIDGNLAGTAGIAELLLQSHGGRVRLLPALPEQWSRGTAKGLRARGGFEIDMEWAEGRLVRARLLSSAGKPCRLWTPHPVSVRRGGADIAGESTGHELVWHTEAGQSYDIVPV
ncbi:glycoside hydrolase family 95 protein [Paenibacillus doosanensis]|uniref:glycoside hydrolase family 95 protein n=1 Tax=Paenibacillus doosanensis TaxID=1229154 RepID=UPI00217F39FC|nr:glycoside hydrolase family 95 protein [Paenibacillus doosanensis]MCS7459754.1 glycoside hydrolase family 95 protein [Paenibacillus doosanensis]